MKSEIILCAGSADCYQKFHKVFDSYLQEEHGYQKGKKRIISKLDSKDMINSDFKVENLLMIENVEIKIKRNLHGIKFGPGGPTGEERQAVIR